MRPFGDFEFLLAGGRALREKKEGPDGCGARRQLVEFSARDFFWRVGWHVASA